MDEAIWTLEAQLNRIDSDPRPDPANKIKVLNELSWALRYTDLSRSYELCQQAQELLAEHFHLGEQAKCQTMLAEIFLRRGDYQQALVTGNATIRLTEQDTALEYLQPYLWSTLGVTHWNLGNLAEALVSFQRQYRTSQQVNDKKLELNALNNIALIQTTSGDLDLANSTYHQALELNKTFQDVSQQPILLNNLAVNLYEAEDYSLALAEALKALDLVQIVKNQTLEISILDTVGMIYTKQRNFSEAVTFFQRSIHLANELEAIADKARSWLRIAEIYTLQGENEAALWQLYQAIQQLEKIGQKKELFECHQLLSQIYEHQGDWVRALHHYKQYHLIKEQIFNEQADNKLKNLQISHEVETLKQEAEIYRLKNVELRAALDQVKQLSGLLPICANCKKIRDDTGYWHDVAIYIRDHSEVQFSHGICPECMEILYPDYVRKRKDSDACSD